MRYKNLQLVALYEQVCCVTSGEFVSNKAKFVTQCRLPLYFSRQFSSTRNKCCTTSWSHKVKLETATQNLQQNNAAPQVEGFCNSYIFRRLYSLSTVSFLMKVEAGYVTSPLLTNVYWTLSRVFAIYTDSSSKHVSLTHARALSKLFTNAFRFFSEIGPWAGLIKARLSYIVNTFVLRPS